MHVDPNPSAQPVTRFEALVALGETAAARTALRDVHARIERIAATLDDPDDRAAYLGNIEANARTLALAREWGEA